LLTIVSKINYWPQNQDKMKTKLNIALEGTCSGDVVGGLLSWTGENLQALLFFADMQKGDSKERAAQVKLWRTNEDSPKHDT